MSSASLMGSLAAEGTALASKGRGQRERRQGKEINVRRSEGRIKEASEVFIGLRKIKKKKPTKPRGMMGIVRANSHVCSPPSTSCPSHRFSFFFFPPLNLFMNKSARCARPHVVQEHRRRKKTLQDRIAAGEVEAAEEMTPPCFPNSGVVMMMMMMMKGN